MNYKTLKIHFKLKHWSTKTASKLENKSGQQKWKSQPKTFWQLRRTKKWWAPPPTPWASEDLHQEQWGNKVLHQEQGE